MHRVALVVALAIAVGVASCGPIAYVHQVTISADDAVAEARAAQAEKWSPYYWTRALQYLHMAREVAAHADFQGANRFGRLATEAALKAKDEGELGQRDPSKLPYLHLGVASGSGSGSGANGGIAPAKEP